MVWWGLLGNAPTRVVGFGRRSQPTPTRRASGKADDRRLAPEDDLGGLPLCIVVTGWLGTRWW